MTFVCTFELIIFIKAKLYYNNYFVIHLSYNLLWGWKVPFILIIVSIGSEPTCLYYNFIEFQLTIPAYFLIAHSPTKILIPQARDIKMSRVSPIGSPMVNNHGIVINTCVPAPCQGHKHVSSKPYAVQFFFLKLKIALAIKKQS